MPKNGGSLIPQAGPRARLQVWGSGTSWGAKPAFPPCACRSKGLLYQLSKQAIAHPKRLHPLPTTCLALAVPVPSRPAVTQREQPINPGPSGQRPGFQPQHGHLSSDASRSLVYQTGRWENTGDDKPPVNVDCLIVSNWSQQPRGLTPPSPGCREGSWAPRG